MHPKDVFVKRASVVLSALNVEPSPSGLIYTGLMSDGITFDEYQQLIGILEGNGLIRQSHHVLSLTEHGKQVADKVDSVLGRKRAD